MSEATTTPEINSMGEASAVLEDWAAPTVTLGSGPRKGEVIQFAEFPWLIAKQLFGKTEEELLTSPVYTEKLICSCCPLTVSDLEQLRTRDVMALVGAAMRLFQLELAGIRDFSPGAASGAPSASPAVNASAPNA